MMKDYTVDAWAMVIYVPRGKDRKSKGCALVLGSETEPSTRKHAAALLRQYRAARRRGTV